VILTSCDENLAGALGGEVHAFQIREVGASTCLRSAGFAYALIPFQRTSSAIASSHGGVSSERSAWKWTKRPCR
jgi:hypothetical protein